MRSLRWSAVFLALCTASVSLAAPPLLTDKTTDLDGDGKPDKVEVKTAGSGPYEVKIKVGKASVDVPIGWSNVQARTVDIRTDDGQIEILLDGVQSGNRRFSLWRYDGTAVRKLLDEDTGGPEGTLRIDGDGIVHLRTRTGFFLRHQLYMLGTGSAGKAALMELPQPFFAVGVTTRCWEPTPIFIDQKGEETLVVIPSGTEIEIVLVSTDEPTAYLIVTPDDLVGWIPADKLSTLDVNNK